MHFVLLNDFSPPSRSLEQASSDPELTCFGVKMRILGMGSPCQSLGGEGAEKFFSLEDQFNDYVSGLSCRILEMFQADWLMKGFLAPMCSPERRYAICVIIFKLFG